MSSPTPTLLPGFSDQVYDAQETFSQIMDAMARPGTIKPVAKLVDAPQPLHATTGAVLLTLADYDSTLWFDDAIKSHPNVQSWVTFHTGAPISEKRSNAEFVIINSFQNDVSLSQFQQGTPEYPDRSATLIIQVESLFNQQKWQLTGPGIECAHGLWVEPYPPGFLQEWRENRAQFPLGVDVILCAPDALVCLPRTVKIEEV